MSCLTALSLSLIHIYAPVGAGRLTVFIYKAIFNFVYSRYALIRRINEMCIRDRVPPVDFDALSQKEGSEECSSEIKARVNKAREIQRRRFKGWSA